MRGWKATTVSRLNRLATDVLDMSRLRNGIACVFYQWLFYVNLLCFSALPATRRQDFEKEFSGRHLRIEVESPTGAVGQFQVCAAEQCRKMNCESKVDIGIF
jgi:hypothetical protein